MLTSWSDISQIKIFLKLDKKKMGRPTDGPKPYKIGVKPDNCIKYILLQNKKLKNMRYEI